MPESIKYDDYHPILEPKKDLLSASEVQEKYVPKLVLVENWLTKTLKQEKEEDEANQDKNVCGRKG